jgi:hypothetical protein
MADLQPLLPRKIPQSVFPPIGDADAPPPIAQAAMGGGLQSLLPTSAPNVTLNPRIGDSNGSRQSLLEADLYKRDNPIAPTTTLGKIGHVAAGIGNVLGDIFAPSTMALIPGTELHSQIQKNRDIGELDDISSLQNQADQRKYTEAQTAYTTARPAIEQAKVLQKLTSSLAPKGIKASMNPDGTIDTEDDTDSQAYKNQQALQALHQGTSEKEAIQSEIAQNHYVAGTPEYAEAQRKLAQVDSRLHVALAGLGLRAEGLQLRKENQAAMNTGIDPATGKPFAGAAQITNDAGDNTTLGARFAPHAITQQQSVGAFNDLSGSVDHTEGALRKMFSTGGHLTDPDVISALADHNTPMAQWIGGLVASGLSPEKIAAVTAIRQNHEQAGILRKSTGGTASEAGSQRILETAPGAGDTDEIALSKVAEQKNVRDRLAPGMTGVAGGVSVSGKKKPAAQSGGTIRAVDQNGILHEAPAGTVLPKGWKAQ